MSEKRTHSILIRLSDLAISGLVLIFVFVPMIVIAFSIRIQDGGPAIFRQTRVGKDLREFTVYKFRTMRVRATGSEAAERPAHRTQIGDMRITPIGRLLRPSHLDELPQLFNVILGNMSLVGVRPDTPMQQTDYASGYWQERHRFRPGMTGPAQIEPGDLTLSERSAKEREWLENSSIRNYYRVLFRTITKVLAQSSN